MFSKRNFFLFATFITGTLSAGSITFSVNPIPLPPGTAINGSGINNVGQITGQTGANGGSAFIGTTSGIIVLPASAGILSPASVAINDLGQVTGSAQVPIGPSSFTLEPFIATTSGFSLTPFTTTPVFAIGAGINNLGQVVGSEQFANGIHGFVGTDQGSTEVTLPSGFTSDSGAFGINNLGQVVGDGINGSGFLQAYFGAPGATVAIPFPAGWNDASGVALNDSGMVVGLVFATTPGQPADQAFIGTIAGTTLIPLPPGATFVQAVSPLYINNLGVVVGDSDAGAWIWDSVNGTRLLSSLVPDGWTVSHAGGINDLGEVDASAAFEGGSSQVVILNPAAVPEPATWTLCSLLLVIVIVGRRIRA